MSKKDDPKPEGSAVGVVKLEDGTYQIVKLKFRGRQLLSWEVKADGLVNLDVKMQMKVAMTRFLYELES